MAATVPLVGVPDKGFCCSAPPNGMGSLGVEALDLKSWDQESSFQPVFRSQKGRNETRINSPDRFGLVENAGKDVTGHRELGARYR